MLGLLLKLEAGPMSVNSEHGSHPPHSPSFLPVPGLQPPPCSFSPLPWVSWLLRSLRGAEWSPGEAIGGWGQRAAELGGIHPGRAGLQSCSSEEGAG